MTSSGRTRSRTAPEPSTVSAAIAAALLAAIGAAGCGSLSDSSVSISKSVSNSISSPSESLSRSSSPEDAYRDDVRDFTAAYLKSGGDVSQLKSEVGAVAKKHGVTDWERSQATYEGIGAGLAKGGASPAELDAYKRTIASSEQQAQWMQDGYDGER
jgi:hypothetical protein